MRLLRLDDSVCSIPIFVAPASRETSPLTRVLVFPPESLPQAGRPYHVPTNDPCSPEALAIVERYLRGMIVCAFCFFFTSCVFYIPPPFYGDRSARPFLFSLTSLLISLPLLFLH